MRIEYRFEDDSNAHDTYVAVFPNGTDININVTNPVLPGYKAVDSLEEGAQNALSTHLDFEVTEDKTIVV